MSKTAVVQGRDMSLAVDLNPREWVFLLDSAPLKACWPLAK